MGSDDQASTVADRPGALAAESPPTQVEAATVLDKPVAVGSLPSAVPASGPEIEQLSGGRTLTTAADALRDEEVERARMFIRLGWPLSVAVMGTVALLGGPVVLQIAVVAAMVVGMIVSFGYHQKWANPQRYSDTDITRLSVMVVINGHIAVLYYGALTIAPVCVVIGIHFTGRTGAERGGRLIFAAALACYAAMGIPIAAGWIHDPGAFATDRPLDVMTRTIGILFVLGMYVLAYVTARAMRRSSLASIDELQRATRVASQRAALMEELRVDLERALRIGGPGRHTEQQVGKWKLGIVLGRGASGEVYEAVHVETGEPAAVKLLRRELLADPAQVERFLREVRASDALSSPHIVRVLDASAADAELPYLAMERLRGATLAGQLRQEPRLPLPVVVELVRQVASGIDAAAAAGIVHRDIKPQNLMRTDAGWSILDFGVARLADANGTLTQGGVVGTPAYMAPEQAQGQPVDARADIYALAAVAYRCLTGHHPFMGADTPALLYGVVHEMPARPGTLAELPADVDACLAIGLAKAPGDRFASGDALATALAAAAAGKLESALRRRADGLVRRQPWHE